MSFVLTQSAEFLCLNMKSGGFNQLWETCLYIAPNESRQAGGCLGDDLGSMPKLSISYLVVLHTLISSMDVFVTVPIIFMTCEINFAAVLQALVSFPVL